MARKFAWAVLTGASVGFAYMVLASLKKGELDGLEAAITQSLTTFTFVLNAALLIDLVKFKPEQFGDLIQSRNTLITGVFLICFVAPLYIIKAFMMLLK